MSGLASNWTLRLLAAENERLAKMSPSDRKAYMREKKLQRLADKDERMSRRLLRQREQIFKRHWTVVWMAIFWLCVPALGVALVAAIWRLCAWVVFS